MPVLRTLKESPKRASPDCDRGADGRCLGRLLRAARSSAARSARSCWLPAPCCRLLLAVVADRSARRRARAARHVDDYDASARNDARQRSRASARSRSKRIISQREAAFDRSNDGLQERNSASIARPTTICRDVIVQHRESQKADYLRGFLIRDYYPQDLRAHAVARRHAGVVQRRIGQRRRTDAAVRHSQHRSRNGDGAAAMAARSRAQVSCSTRSMASRWPTSAPAKEMAVRRFKISQARKILTGAKQLETLAEVGEGGAERGLDAVRRERRAVEERRQAVPRFPKRPPPLRAAHQPVAVAHRRRSLGVPFVAACSACCSADDPGSWRSESGRELTSSSLSRRRYSVRSPRRDGDDLVEAGDAGQQLCGGVVAEAGDLAFARAAGDVAFVRAFDDPPREVFVDRQQLEQADAAAIAAAVALLAAARLVDGRARRVGPADRRRFGGASASAACGTSGTVAEPVAGRCTAAPSPPPGTARGPCRSAA